MYIITLSKIYHLASQTEGRNDNREHNSCLLTKRCYHLFTPDVYFYYLDDGYQIDITPYLRIFPDLSIAKKNELQKNAPDIFCRDWYLEKLQEEPFWWDGYMAIFHGCMTKHDWQGGEDILLRASDFFPAEIVLTKLYLLAVKAKNKRLYEIVNRRKNILSKDQENFINGRYANYVYQLLEQDQRLKPILLRWLQKYTMNDSPAKSSFLQLTHGGLINDDR